MHPSFLDNSSTASLFDAGDASLVHDIRIFYNCRLLAFDPTDCGGSTYPRSSKIDEIWDLDGATIDAVLTFYQELVR
jgi:hypothetical protein